MAWEVTGASAQPQSCGLRPFLVQVCPSLWTPQTQQQGHRVPQKAGEALQGVCIGITCQGLPVCLVQNQGHTQLSGNTSSPPGLPVEV